MAADDALLLSSSAFVARFRLPFSRSMPFLLGDAPSCVDAASTTHAVLPSASPPPFHFLCLTLRSFPPVPLLLPAGFGGHPTLTWFVSWGMAAGLLASCLWRWSAWGPIGVRRRR